MIQVTVTGRLMLRYTPTKGNVRNRWSAKLN